jgi:hypothetical protein
MPTVTLYRFPVAEAARLASLSSIEQDLLGVQSYCHLLERLATGGRVDSIEWEAITSAAVVRYARCFSRGVRSNLSHTLVDAANQQLREDHQYFIDMRNKHVAHSVNAFEENDVVLHVDDEFTSADQITQVGTMQHRVIGFPNHMLTRLADLAAWVFARVREQRHDEGPKILAAARRFPLIAIKAHGTAQLGADASSAAASRRRKAP